MVQFTSQFAIINKIKSVVKKTGGLFSSGNNGITAAIARKIQKTAYDVSRVPEKDTYTPPYMWIAEELQASDPQIFKASVFCLANIAVNETRYKNDIQTLLKKNLDVYKDDKERTEYIREKMEYIAAFHRK